jgi:hypothetical protein
LEIPLVPEPEKVSITNYVKTKKRKMPDGICEGMPENVSVTNDVETKKRKMPDRICEGMMLVQNGLKIMRSALSETDLAELKDRFAVHLSRLEDAVSHLASFSDKI